MDKIDSKTNIKTQLITYEDHQSVVAECRRLLNTLKWNYERNLEALTTNMNEYKMKIKYLRKERNVWKKERRILKKQERIKDLQIATLTSENKATLNCLKDLLDYSENLEISYEDKQNRIKQKTKRNRDRLYYAIPTILNKVDEVRHKSLKSDKPDDTIVCDVAHVSKLYAKIACQQRTIKRLYLKNKKLNASSMKLSKMIKLTRSLQLQHQHHHNSI